MRRTFVSLILLTALCATPAVAQRLPRTILPTHYQLTFSPDLAKETFEGDETIHVSIQEPVREIRLNAVDITFGEVTVTAAGKTQPASVQLETKDQVAVLRVDATIPPGPAIIRVRYSGILNRRLVGFYIGEARGRKYATTQMESTDARYAFPSFDEPAFKATFDIALVVDNADKAFSNGAQISDTPGPAAGKHTVRFATTPRMSTYLVAMAVGDFQCLQDQAGGIPIRVCGTPDQVQKGRFALEAAKHFLTYFNDYYGISYPFGKLDHLGVPDFAWGAMENTGLITYREIFLLDDEKAMSLGKKKGIADIVAHEMAHMWFGDLVTMEWWDDIWLNEGFATWMSSKAVSSWRPEWNIALDEAASTGWPMGTDVLESTRQIRKQAETVQEIPELFDGIAYGKAAAMLRMIESYIGEETFRNGIRTYLKRHAYGNATADDFSRALSEASSTAVRDILQTFVEQPGVPLVTVDSQCSGGSTRLQVTQQRFFANPAMMKTPSKELWTLPLCFRTAAGESRCEVVRERQQSIEIPGCHEVVVVNPKGRGYYLTAYSQDDLPKLGAMMASLDPAERLNLLRDQWYLVRVGRVPLSEYLELTSRYSGERERAVVQRLLAGLIAAEVIPVGSDLDQYREWVRGFLQPLARELGWRAAPNEPAERGVLRASVLGTLGQTGRDPATLREARRLALAYLKNADAVDPSMVETVLSLGALGGDAELYDNYLSAMRKAGSPQLRDRLRNALSQFRQPELLDRTLKLALSPEVKTQDAAFVITGVMFNREGQTLGWRFIRQHWSEIEKTVPTHNLSSVVGSTAALCDAENRREVEQFFTEHPVPTARQTLIRSLDRIDRCIDLVGLQRRDLSAWLSSKRSESDRRRASP